MIVHLFLFCFVVQTLGVPRREVYKSQPDIGQAAIRGFQSANSGIGRRTLATAGQFPFLAVIRTQQTSDHEYFCTGTLLNAQWVVTAGHCVNGAISHTVYLGSATLNPEDPTILTLATYTHVLHPEYDPETLKNDIGLIKFRAPIMYTDYIKPINILPVTTVADNSSLTTVAWEEFADNDQSAISYLTVITMSNKECKLYYEKQIADSIVCAKTEHKGETLAGSTGGPLVQYVNRFEAVLVGVGSFFSGNSSIPSGFTRVYDYVNWIRRTINF